MSRKKEKVRSPIEDLYHTCNMYAEDLLKYYRGENKKRGSRQNEKVSK